MRRALAGAGLGRENGALARGRTGSGGKWMMPSDERGQTRSLRRREGGPGNACGGVPTSESATTARRRYRRVFSRLCTHAESIALARARAAAGAATNDGSAPVRRCTYEFASPRGLMHRSTLTEPAKPGTRSARRGRLARARYSPVATCKASHIIPPQPRASSRERRRARAPRGRRRRARAIWASDGTHRPLVDVGPPSATPSSAEPKNRWTRASAHTVKQRRLPSTAPAPRASRRRRRRTAAATDCHRRRARAAAPRTEREHRAAGGGTWRHAGGTASLQAARVVEHPPELGVFRVNGRLVALDVVRQDVDAKVLEASQQSCLSHDGTAK